MSGTPEHPRPSIELRVFETEGDVAAAVARLLADRLAGDPELILGLPTGRTPIPLYREIVHLYRAGLMTFASARTFNLDEFLGPASRPIGCYRAFMNRHLFDHVDLDPGHINFLHHNPASVEAECARYERAIAGAGGIDVQILGLGANGHVGFNEPAHTLSASTHEVRLTRQTRSSNAALFGGRLARVPRRGVSVGMGAILRARSIVMLATGTAKARPVAAMLHGAVTTRFPASLLQLHRDVVVFVDRAADAKETRGTR